MQKELEVEIVKENDNQVNIRLETIISSAIEISNRIKDDNKIPTTIIGIARGGLILTQLLAYSLNVKDVKTISIQLSDNADTKAESLDKIYKIFQTLENECYRNNILFTDDLIDSGNTIDLIKNGFYKFKKDYPESKIEINFAVSFMDEEYAINLSDSNIDYYVGNIKPNGWLVFPWDTL